MASALKTKPKSTRPLLSKSRSDSSLRKKSPGPSISSFGRPKSASKATEDRPKRVLKENRVPQEGLKNSNVKRKSDEPSGEMFREERTDTQAAPSKSNGTEKNLAILNKNLAFRLNSFFFNYLYRRNS